MEGGEGKSKKEKDNNIKVWARRQGEEGRRLEGGGRKKKREER